MKNVNRISKLLVFILLISAVFSQSGRDLTETEVSAFAFKVEGEMHTTVEFNVNVMSADFNSADGVRFTFDESVNVLNAFVASELEDPAAILINGNEVMFGDSSNGVFNGDGIFENNNEYVFVVHLDESVQAPINISYTVYDDGWAQDFCINDNNCEQCNDYGWGMDCDGNYITVAMNAEGMVYVDNIEMLAAPSQDPVIMNIVDIDNDQGKQMILSWHPGELLDLSYFNEFSVSRYSPDPSDYSSGGGNFYGEYFTSPGSGVSPNFGELFMTREDSVISFNFDQNPIGVYDDFQVRWTGEINAPSSGAYAFRTFSDDGVRLFINGELVIDEWRDFGMTNHYGSIDLDAGQHSLVLEYYENGGGAQCYLFWTVPNEQEELVTSSGTGLTVSDLGTWDYLTTVPWTGMDPYAVVVNTVEDKIPTAFRVTAHTENPNVFFHSESAIGNSYDNIAPAAPNGLESVVTDTDVYLTWNASDEEDFNFYSVHRALDSLFQPNLSNFIGYSTTPMYTDLTAPWNVDIYYKVSATDFGGNLGQGSGSSSAYIAVNRAPQVFDVAISPAIPAEGDDITLSYTFYDPDGDDEVGSTRSWYKNGVMTDYSGLTLPATATACGEEWYATLAPSDGELFGPIVFSNVVTICGFNTAPVWNDSIPVIHIAEDSQGNDFEMGNLVSDAEQAISQLEFSVVGNTNNARVAASFDGSRLIVSAVSQDFYGSSAATLTLRADDGNDIADASVEVNIDPINDIPVITDYVGANSFDEDATYLFELYDFIVFDPDDNVVDMTLSVIPGSNYSPSYDTPGLITTPLNFNGEINVQVEILDGSGAAAVTHVQMFVNAINDPAFITTTSLDFINNGPATEEQTYSITISWKDPDGTADASVYDIILGGPVSNWMEINNIYSAGSGADLQYNAILSGMPDDINLPDNDLSFTIVDNSEGLVTETVEYFYIPIESVNDAPSVVSYTGPMALEEDGSMSFSIDKFAVEDVDNSPIDFSLVLLPPAINYMIGSDSLSIYPDLNYNGPIDVSALISDGDKHDVISFSLDVTPVNDALVLEDIASQSATEETSFNMQISWTDIDGVPSLSSGYSVELDGSASQWLSVVGGGVVTDSSASGPVEMVLGLAGLPDDENLNQNDLSITVIDHSEGQPISQTIYTTISIEPVNDAPVVLDYVGSAQVDEEGDFEASVNDFIVEDVDNDFPFDFSIYVLPGENYVVSGDSSFATPLENYNGVITVNYIISDGGVSIPFSLPVEVLPVNDDPILNSYVGVTSFDEDTNLTLSGSDFSVVDPDSNSNDYTVQIEGGQNYIVSMDGISIIPDENYNGLLNVTASVSDFDGGVSNSISFDLIVNPVNDAPVIEDLAITPSVPDFSDNLVATYSFSDIDGDTEGGTVVEWFKNGELQTAETSNIVSFGSTLCDEEWYAVITPSDGEVSGVSYTSNSVTICGLNTPPEWTWGGTFRLYEDSSAVVNMYEKMIDNEQAPSQIVYTLLSQASPALVSASIDGHELHLETIVADYSGAYADTLVLKADDGGYQDTTTVVVNIAPINDAPVAVDDSYTVDEGGDIVADISSGMLANDIDVDGDNLQIIIVDEPVDGVLLVNTDMSFSYSHDGNESTHDAFTYMAFDGEYYSNIGTVDIFINPVNDPPEIVFASNFETLEETPFDIVLDDFIVEDPDTDIGSITLQISDGTNYTVAAISNGYTVTPVANFSGELIIPVSVSDGDTSSATLDLLVDVIGGNDAPVIISSLGDISVDEDSENIIISLYGSETAPYFFDEDGDNLAFAVHTGGSGLIEPLVDNDTLHIFFSDNAYGEDTLYVSATDVSGESVTDTVFVSVASVNDSPVIYTAAYFVTEEEEPVHVTIHDFVYDDVDNDASELSLVLYAGDGYTVDMTEDGYLIVPGLDVIDTLYVPSAISDGSAESELWDLMVVVLSSNDAPVVVNAAADIFVDEDSESIMIDLMGSETEPYFADSDGDTLNFVVSVSGLGVLSAEIDMSMLHLSFYPNVYGSDTLYITATDPSGDSVSDTILVTVLSVNDAPQIVIAPSFVTDEDDSLDVFLHEFIIRDEDSPSSDISIQIELDQSLLSVVDATGLWEGMPDPNRQPSNLIFPYDGPGWDGTWLTLPTIFDVGAQGQGLWTGANVIEAGSSTEESVYFDFGSSKTVTEIRLYRNQNEERFPKRIQVMQGGTYGEASGGWTEVGPEVVLDVSDIPTSSSQDNQDYYSLDISGMPFSGQYLRLSFRGNFGEELGGNYGKMQLSAVQFYGWESIDMSVGLHEETRNRDELVIIPIDNGFRIIPSENFFGELPLIITAFDGISYSDPYSTILSVLPINDVVELIAPLADINVNEDSDPVMLSISGTETSPYFIDVDGDSIQYAVSVTGSDIFEVMTEGDSIEIVFSENMNGVDTIHVSATDGSGAFVVDTVVVSVSSVNDIPTEFALLSPADSVEVVITAASVAQGATIDVSWTASEDADGDTVGYGFVLFNGSYSLQTDALYSVDIEFTELSIAHSSAIALLEIAGYQSLTCDWLVFATDGQDTTFSSEIRTLIIDARTVLSTEEAAIPEVFALHQNYPNPFNPTTTIKYDLPEAKNVQVLIYDIMGRKVRTLIDEHQDIGYRSIQWDASDDYGRGVSAGMYVYTIQAGDFRQVRKMILLK